MSLHYSIRVANYTPFLFSFDDRIIDLIVLVPEQNLSI